MPSQTDIYLQAHRSFVGVQRELKALGEIVQTAASQLMAYPDAFIFTNIEPSLPPLVVLGANAKHVDATKWKSAAEITTLLAELHASKWAAREAWKALPRELREGLIPPH